MEYNEIAIDRVGTDGRVARITLNQPERLNVLSPAMLIELGNALAELESDPSARVIVLRGAGRAFCAGYDLTGPDLMASPTMESAGTYATSSDEGQPLVMNFASALKRGADLQLAMWNLAKVVIAEIHGYCIAGGMEFAMMTDLVTASEDCLIGHPGSRGLGIARNAAILPLVTNMRKAKELILTGGSVTGTRAEELGLVNYAWPAELLEERTILFADRVANLSADHLALLKSAANRFYENMGIRSSIAAATELDAIGQHTESHYTWSELLREQGLKGALEWRDGMYGDYGFRRRDGEEPEFDLSRP